MENYKNKLPETPITNSLDPENREYVENRFPLTNDDNLREDLALKIITESNFLDTLRSKEERGDQTLKDFQDYLWVMYEKILQNKFSSENLQEIKNKIHKEVIRLIDELRILKTRQDLEERFKLQKSDITQEERLVWKEERINEIERELFNISREEVVTESNLKKVFEDYSKLLKKYNHFQKMYSEDFNVADN